VIRKFIGEGESKPDRQVAIDHTTKEQRPNQSTKRKSVASKSSGGESSEKEQER